MNFIDLTHANLNERVAVVAELVAGIYYSPHHKCTMVVASGGAIFPAKESTEEIKTLLTKTKPSSQGEEQK